MAEYSPKQSPNGRARLKSLFEQYRGALSDLRAAEQAQRSAARRALELRIQIESVAHENDLYVYRTVFAVETDRTTARPRLRRLASGRNLNVQSIFEQFASSSGGQGGGTVTYDCPECDGALEAMADDPNFLEGACVCSCYQTGDGMMSMVECPPPPAEPE